eukprot:UN27405
MQSEVLLVVVLALIICVLIYFETPSQIQDVLLGEIRDKENQTNPNKVVIEYSENAKNNNITINKQKTYDENEIRLRNILHLDSEENSLNTSSDINVNNFKYWNDNKILECLDYNENEISNIQLERNKRKYMLNFLGCTK